MKKLLSFFLSLICFTSLFGQWTTSNSNNYINTNNTGKIQILSNSGGGGQLQLGNNEDNEVSISFSTLGNSYFSTFARRWAIGTDIWAIGTGKFGIGVSTQTDAVKLVVQETGEVGIGTTSPNALLELNSSIQNTDFKVSNSYGSTGRNRLLLSISDRTWHIENDGNMNMFKIRDQNADKDRFIIDYDGHVGIGTTVTGSHMLAVEGSIGAREIKVESNGWSDFVFYPEYTLLPLVDLEKYLQDNQHLPDIPSEKEVLENGISLGEMDAKLLQKLEELTLYIIEMNKEINQLKAKNSELEQQLSEVTH